MPGLEAELLLPQPLSWKDTGRSHQGQLTVLILQRKQFRLSAQVPEGKLGAWFTHIPSSWLELFLLYVFCASKLEEGEVTKRRDWEKGSRGPNTVRGYPKSIGDQCIRDEDGQVGHQVQPCGDLVTRTICCSPDSSRIVEGGHGSAAGLGYKAFSLVWGEMSRLWRPLGSCH